MIRSLLSCLLMLQVLLFSLQVATVQARADAATEYRIQTFPLERNGIALHLQRLTVAGTQPQRQILLVHGLTYSSHEFDVDYADYSLARYLAARGFAVWTFDVAGYGESQEVKDGFMPDSDYAAEDAAAAAAEILKVSGQKKLDVLGWSWGTVTSSRFVARHPEMVKKLVAYCREQEKIHNKNFRFTMTTNGMLIDEDVIDFCNKECHNVVLSLDGRKEVHDRFRKDYAGHGSYDAIVPKFQEFVRKRGDKGYYMRGTYTHYNTDFTNDIFHMADLGFTELSMEPVVCDPSDPSALTEADLPILKEQYEILAKEMIKRNREGRGFTFYHYMIDLTAGPCIYKRISGCGSGTEYMAVTPWGDLYPCHQFVGEEAYRLGDIWNGVTNRELREEFRACNAYARPECADCWAKLYCSGGCAANAYHASGSIRGVYKPGCELFRKRIECAIMMKVAEEQDRESTASETSENA